MDEDATWYGSRPRRRPHCIRRVPSAPRKGQSSTSPSFRPMSIVATVAHLSYCWALVKITHDLYDPDVLLNLAYYSGTVTRGNKYKLINHRFHYDLRKYYFSEHIVNIWNSLPNHVVDVNSVNVFKACLDRFMDQDVKFDFTADLTGTGDRSVNVIYET